MAKEKSKPKKVDVAIKKKDPLDPGNFIDQKELNAAKESK